MLALAATGLSFERSLGARRSPALTTTGPAIGTLRRRARLRAISRGRAQAIFCAAMIVGRMEALVHHRALQPGLLAAVDRADMCRSATAGDNHRRKSAADWKCAESATHTAPQEQQGPPSRRSPYNLRLRNNGCRQTEPAGRVPEQRPQGQGACHDLPDERGEAAGRHHLVRQLLRAAPPRRPVAAGLQARDLDGDAVAADHALRGPKITDHNCPDADARPASRPLQGRPTATRRTRWPRR